MDNFQHVTVRCPFMKTKIYNITDHSETTRNRLPITPIGNQHRKSVATTSNKFLATFKSFCRFFRRIADFILTNRISENINHCPIATSTNVAKLRPTKIETEYIHPGGLSLVKGRAIHTPDFE